MPTSLVDSPDAYCEVCAALPGGTLAAAVFEEGLEECILRRVFGGVDEHLGHAVKLASV